MLFRLLIALIGLWLPSFDTPLALAHEGSLDGFGCHPNSGQKSYHCHRGLLAGQTFVSKAEMLHALEGMKSGREGSGNPAEVTLHQARTESHQTCIRENFTRQIMCGEALR
jgi:hypothetical protein